MPSKTCKLPISYELMHPHTIRDAGFWTECWWHAGRSPSSLARRTRRPWFPTRMSNLDSSDQRTLFHFETVHFKWDLVHRTWRRFWTMFTYDFLFAWSESESEWALLARYVYTYEEFVIVTEVPQCNRMTVTGQDTSSSYTITIYIWSALAFPLETNPWSWRC